MTTRGPIFQFDADEVFARIRAKPVRWDDLAGSRDAIVRRRLRPIIEGLLASGAVKKVQFGGHKLLAAAAWQPTKAQQLQDIYERCRPTNGCLCWSGYVDPQRGPIVHVVWGSGERSARRQVWGLHLRKMDFGHTITMTCENPDDCIRFEHMKRVGRGHKQEGKPKTLAHRRAIALAKRKDSKLDEVKVLEILSNSKSHRQMARDMDVSASTVQAVRARDRWRNYKATPFSGLDAANDSERRRA